MSAQRSGALGVCIVWTERRPDEWTDVVRRHKPDAEIVVIPNARHALFVDQPEQFNEAVGSFLRRALAR